MNGNVRVGQLALQIFFQMVAHFMSLFHAGILGQHQVEVDETMAALLAGAHFMETGQLAGMLADSSHYFFFFRPG